MRRNSEAENLAEEVVCDMVEINLLREIAPGTEYIRDRIMDFLER